MPLYYVHECSKCKFRNEALKDSLPKGWIRGTAEDYLEAEYSFTWCPKCWIEVRATKDTAVPSPFIPVP